MRSLEEYLRSLWKNAQKFRNSPHLSPDEFFDLLSESFTQEAPPFDEKWRSQYRDELAELPGFEPWETRVQRQIVDLREMAEQGTLANELRYYGMKAPRGCHWSNFDPCTFLECATVGTFGGWEPGDNSGRQFVPGLFAVLGEDGEIKECNPEDVPRPTGIILPVTWEVFQDFLYSGQIYE